MGQTHVVVSFLVSLVILFLPLINGGLSSTNERTLDGSEKWGYVEVRPKAHMFWWYYKSPYTTQDPNNPWPIILWLSGGPGSSGVGNGDFNGVGPLDSSLKPRNLTWLRKADLLFVDNPVGSGYSYVEDEELLAKTDEDVATDLTTLLIQLFNKNQTLQKMPLYILGGSYGAKFAVTLGLSTLKAIQDKKLKLLLGGIHTIVVKKIKQQIANGSWKAAAESGTHLVQVIHAYSNFVDLTNFLLDDGSSSYDDLERLMNGVIRNKLKIIPENVRWVFLSPLVSGNMGGDFMKPRINELDVLCGAKGTETWVKKLKWKGLETYLRMNRTPIYCEDEKVTKGFTKSHKNLHFYWILGAGHNPPEDQPCVTFNMVGDITNYQGVV
ncbi:hypothetical protein L1987_10438 [Smallanthus sonchifolius]|uniref:Uncharacterized protein n=1 Tax=Smallanthus sonchifolius TaxID=185202 RepID=A0ACB9JS31_9ASTR|nr:hypothetical protein L1987_10438 [Smallanthus sonchifolius]